jgi:hypothetical protein
VPVQLVEVDDVGALQHGQVHRLLAQLVEVRQVRGQRVADAPVGGGLLADAEVLDHLAQAVRVARALDSAVALEHAQEAEGGGLGQVRAAGQLADADAGERVVAEGVQQGHGLVDGGAVVTCGGRGGAAHGFLQHSVSPGIQRWSA